MGSRERAMESWKLKTFAGRGFINSWDLRVFSKIAENDKNRKREKKRRYHRVIEGAPESVTSSCLPKVGKKCETVVI